MGAPVIAVPCFPCFAVLAIWLWRKFLQLIGRGDDERWDSRPDRG
jgi:hypothetical protein